LDAYTNENEHKKGMFLVKKKLLMFPGEPPHYVMLTCKKCKNDLSKEQDIINWNYRLRGYQAYQITMLHNIYLCSPQNVDYTTGKYTVAETFCKQCDESLGVKYIEAPSDQNAFKIGTYLIEKPKIEAITKEEDNKRKEIAKDEKTKSKKSQFFSTFISFLRKRA